MNFLIVLVAVVPLVLGFNIQEVAETQSRSVSGQIVDLIEAVKEQMPCGFPGMGIPPLAPLKISHQEIYGTIKLLQLAGEIENFRLDGLNDFETREMKVNALSSKMTYKFNWNHIQLNTDYEVTSSLDNNRMKRSGLAKMSMQNLTAWGTVKYSLGVISGNIKIKSFDLNLSVDAVNTDISGLSKYGIINKKLNEIIAEWIMLAINDNTENFSQLSNGYVVPMINNLIGDISLSDLLAMIGGGSGGEGGGEGEKGSCVPENN